jgi:hypothetical protein
MDAPDWETAITAAAELEHAARRAATMALAAAISTSAGYAFRIA